MKLSVSLPAGDVEFVDRYVSDHDEASRSAVVRKARLREREPGDACGAVWNEWVQHGGEAWDVTAGDGLGGDS